MVQLSRFAVASLLLPLLWTGVARPVAAQTFVLPPPPVVSYYSPPVVSYYAPPVVSYAAPPTVSFYPPSVAYYAAPAPMYYAPAAVTTSYRYGLFGRRVATTTYYYGR